MIKTLLNIALVLMLTLAAIGCSGHSDSEEPAAGYDGMVNFSIAVYAGDPEKPGSRADTLPGDDYYGDPATPHERIRTLRAIILRPDGRVEHNVYLQRTIPADGLGQYSYIRVKVVGGETKTVYLFANEASLAHCGVDVNLNDYTAGTTFPKDDFSKYQLNCDAGQPLIDNENGTEKLDIPMTEAFDVDIRLPQADGTDYEQSADLFITRATVKFSFHFQSTAVPTVAYSFSELAIESIGNREYLMPDAASVTYVPEKSHSFEDRYITKYEVPSGTENMVYTFHPGDKLTFTTDYVPKTEIAYEPQLYFAETKLAADKKYILKLKLAGDEDYCAEVPLPNLPSLPRNTHVKINVSLENSDVSCTVDVLPYTAVPLNPSFGFDKPLPPIYNWGDVPPWLEVDPDEAE